MTIHDTKSLVPAATARVAPFFGALQREIDRVFADFGSFDVDIFNHGPRMNLSEDENGMELTIEVPGLTEKDVEVELRDDILTISGEAETRTEKSERNVRFAERRFGAFSRSVRLPEGVDGGRLSASMKNGLLTISAPRAADKPAKKTSIPVKAG